MVKEPEFNSSLHFSTDLDLSYQWRKRTNETHLAVFLYLQFNKVQFFLYICDSFASIRHDRFDHLSLDMVEQAGRYTLL